MYVHVVPGAHEPPKGLQGASNYVQRHLTMSGSGTFLIWTFPKVENLLCGLRLRVKHKQRTACRGARGRVLLFHSRDANSRLKAYRDCLFHSSPLQDVRQGWCPVARPEARGDCHRAPRIVIMRIAVSYRGVGF